MNRPLIVFARLFLLISITLANLPSWSKATVCVIGAGKVVPLGECGMPCCAVKAKPVRKDCCKAKVSLDAAGAVCLMTTMACRCETRYTVLTAPPFAKVDRSLAVSAAHDFPAIILLAPWEIPSLGLDAFEPGIRGVDSGPPRKTIRTPKQCRAPPVCV